MRGGGGGAGPARIRRGAFPPAPRGAAAVRTRRSPEPSRARELAAEIGDIGRGYLEGGDTARAVELLEEAYTWDDENGLLLAELTLAYLRSGNFAFARFYLELAESQAPAAPPEAYAVLGDVYHSLHRLEDAVLAWEQAQRLGGEDPALLARLSRVRQELSLTAGQKFLGTEVFSLHYDASIRPRRSNGSPSASRRATASSPNSSRRALPAGAGRDPLWRAILLFARLDPGLGLGRL